MILTMSITFLYRASIFHGTNEKEQGCERGTDRSVGVYGRRSPQTSADLEEGQPEPGADQATLPCGQQPAAHHRQDHAV